MGQLVPLQQGIVFLREPLAVQPGESAELSVEVRFNPEGGYSAVTARRVFGDEGEGGADEEGDAAAGAMAM